MATATRRQLELGEDLELEVIPSELEGRSVPATTAVNPLATLTEAAVKQVEEQVHLFKRFRTACLQLTTPNMWTSYPNAADSSNRLVRLQASAVKLLRLPFNLKIEVVKDANGQPKFEKTTYTDSNGSAYRYELWGAVAIGEGESVPVMGRCSSRDKFLARRDQEWVPVADVDEATVKLKCLANFYVHCVEACGFGGLTMEDLKGAGVDVSKIPGIDYTKGQGTGQAAAASAARTGETMIEKIKGVLGQISDKQPIQVQVLRKVTTFTGADGTEVPGKTDPAKLTDKQAPRAYGVLQKLADDIGKGKTSVEVFLGIKPAADAPPSSVDNSGDGGVSPFEGE